MLFLNYDIYLCVASRNRFLSGLLLSIAPAKSVVPHLQTVFQADAAHMNFGKYTLYSCYGITANCNAFLVAIGILFGNEDKHGWDLFWKFAVKHHPSLNDNRITIITDQQKGITESLQGVLPKAVNFFCSFHRRQNILQYVKGGKSDYSCHWFYNVLVGCGSMSMIDRKRHDIEEFMDEKALRYLGLVNDHQQYPAARVQFGLDQGAEVCMFQRSLASTAESMNAAHKGVRDRTAVDPINSLLLLLKLEARR